MADLESMQNDATAYGGRFSGFDPAYSDQVGSEAIYTPSVDDNMFSFDSGLSDMFSEYGSGYSPSSNVYGEASSPNTTDFQQGLSTVNDFFNNNKFGKLAGMALNFSPVGKAFNVARGVANAIGTGNPMGAVSGLAGAYGGLPGAMMNAGYNASKGNFSNAGALAGGLAGGPVGSFVGGQAGSMLNGRTGGATGPAPSGGFNMEGAVGGLAQLYAASQAGKGESAAAGGNQAVQDQISQLSNMYSQNSPYAQQLRQTLERKDAAAGRRSQYGPREVQLQAALADKAAQTAGTIGNLATSNQNNQLALQKQKNQTRAQQLALLMNLGKQSGAFGGLNNLFSGGGGQPAYTPPPAVGQGATFEVPDTSYWENA